MVTERQSQLIVSLYGFILCGPLRISAISAFQCTFNADSQRYAENRREKNLTATWHVACSMIDIASQLGG